MLVAVMSITPHSEFRFYERLRELVLRFLRYLQLVNLYSSTQFINDIAVVELAERIQFDDYKDWCQFVRISLFQTQLNFFLEFKNIFTCGRAGLYVGLVIRQ